MSQGEASDLGRVIALLALVWRRAAAGSGSFAATRASAPHPAHQEVRLFRTEVPEFFHKHAQSSGTRNKSRARNKRLEGGRLLRAQLLWGKIAACCPMGAPILILLLTANRGFDPMIVC
jgi:hypothetical protein